jgi:glutamate-1-semialdehyde 2,1-aminomutase
MLLVRGEGCRVWNAEGDALLDFSMGWGSCFVGHAHPRVAAAVCDQAVRGSNFAHVTEAALLLAERVRADCPAAARLRFCASGTEATMYCQRLARAYTGRGKILKFEGAYHGANEIGVTSLFPTGQRPFPEPEPTSAGIEGQVRGQVLVAPFNDLDSTAAIIRSHAADLAAVIVEPLHRCLPPAPGFLEGLRALCGESGALLIFDEVVTGFRLARGGAQEYYGVQPDLVAYGKALGGGYPIGAFGGRADILDLVREDRLGRGTYVWTASTLGGNPVSCRAGLAALEVFAAEEVYPRMHALGAHLRAGMRAVLEATGVAGQVIGDGPLAQVVFSGAPVTDYRSTRAGDAERARRVMLGLLSRGVFLNPMGTKLYLSIAHDEAVCDAFLDRFGETLRACA